MIACETTPKVEYIHEIPDVTFPVFPIPDCVVYDDETDLVSMPLWYWKEIAAYKIDIDAINKYFTLTREIDNTGGMRELSKETRKKVDKSLEGNKK